MKYKFILIALILSFNANADFIKAVRDFAEHNKILTSVVEDVFLAGMTAEVEPLEMITGNPALIPVEDQLGFSTLVDEIDEGVIDTGINEPQLTWENGSADEILASLREDGWTDDEIQEYVAGR
jgi:hypothetical protein